MRTLDLHTQFNCTFDQLQTTAQHYELSPVARYSISKLLRQVSCEESAEFQDFQAKIQIENYNLLHDTLRKLYPDELQLTQALVQLENLIHCYTTLSVQSHRYLDLNAQMTQIKQQILQIFGFTPPQS